MINPRAIATIGIGFGALAISTLGFLVPVVEESGGGSVRSRGHQARQETYRPAPAINDDAEVVELLAIIFNSGVLHGKSR